MRFKGRDIPVRINSQGFRDREYASKGPTALRILGLGDSFAFGFGVNEEETYLARLEALLNDGKAEVINAGLAGMGPDSEARLLEMEGPRLDPDLVLVGFYVGNDLIDVLTRGRRARLRDGPLESRDATQERWSRPLRPGQILSAPLGPLPRPETSGLKARLRAHSHAYRFLTSRYAALRTWWRRRASGVPRGEFTPFNEEAFCLKHYPPEFEEAWAQTKVIFCMMKDWCDRHGSRIAIVAIPTRSQVYPEIWEEVRRTYGLRDEDFDLDKPLAKLNALGEEAGISVIDLLPALRRASSQPGERLYYPRDPHWTPRGHAVAAEELIAQLRSRGLLDPAGGPRLTAGHGAAPRASRGTAREAIPRRKPSAEWQ